MLNLLDKERKDRGKQFENFQHGFQDQLDNITAKHMTVNTQLSFQDQLDNITAKHMTVNIQLGFQDQLNRLK